MQDRSQPLSPKEKIQILQRASGLVEDDRAEAIQLLLKAGFKFNDVGESNLDQFISDELKGHEEALDGLATDEYFHRVIKDKGYESSVFQSKTVKRPPVPAGKLIGSDTNGYFTRLREKRPSIFQKLDAATNGSLKSLLAAPEMLDHLDLSEGIFADDMHPIGGQAQRGVSKRKPKTTGQYRLGVLLCQLDDGKKVAVELGFKKGNKASQIKTLSKDVAKNCHFRVKVTDLATQDQMALYYLVPGYSDEVNLDSHIDQDKLFNENPFRSNETFTIASAAITSRLEEIAKSNPEWEKLRPSVRLDSEPDSRVKVSSLRELNDPLFHVIPFGHVKGGEYFFEMMRSLDFESDLRKLVQCGAVEKMIECSRSAEDVYPFRYVATDEDYLKPSGRG